MGVLQVSCEFSILRTGFESQVEQHVQPEVRRTEYLVAFLHEADGEQAGRQFDVGAQLGGDTGKEHRLPSASRGDDQRVLAGIGIDVASKDLEHDGEFVLPDHELLDDLLVRLECSGIERADGAMMRFGQ